MAKILLAGGSGFIGSRLSAYLSKKGHQVHILSRKKDQKGAFIWHPDKGTIDKAAFDGVTAVVNLAGASLAEGRWTTSYKKTIVESRVQSANVLYEALRENKGSVETYISASAIGYYGNTGDAWVGEDAPPGDDFLAKTCIQWEDGARQFLQLGIRTVMIRTGLVLDGDEGILPVMSRPVRLGVGSTLGGGRQYMSWIHIDDLCGIYARAVEDGEMRGPYNAVAPAPVRQKEFMSSMAKSYHRPLWLPHVPAAVLKLVLGEKADLVLYGQRVSAEKISEAGYGFKYRILENAMEEIAQRKNTNR